jgi:hypothetical protein
VYSIWNTTVGENFTLASSGYYTGTYWPGQSGQQAFDNNMTTEYTNHGMCNYTTAAMSIACGEKTGFYLTMSGGPVIFVAFYMGTNIFSALRDPMVITIEGSNLNGSDLTLGSSWTLIYNGPSGLLIDPGRSMLGMLQVFANPSVRLSSYRLLVTSKRGVESSAGYSEIYFVIY